MKKGMSFLKILASACVVLNAITAHAAVSTLTSEFTNPADLDKVGNLEITNGILLISPRFKFDGTNGAGVPGTAKTENLVDFLPYLRAAKRIDEKFVVGLDIHPKNYGHVLWNVGGFTSANGTDTVVLDYVVRPKLSYQVDERLTLAAGLNFTYVTVKMAAYDVNGNGQNMVNKTNDFIGSFTVGANYAINDSTFLSAVYDNGYNTQVSGKSVNGNTISRNYTNLATDPKIIMVGLGKLLNPQLAVQGKIYWSSWNNFKKFEFKNTASAGEKDFLVPSHTKNTLSFEASSRYQCSENKAIFGAVLYETNPSPDKYNSVAYPVAPFMALFAGIEYGLTPDMFAEVSYGYGFFSSKAKIKPDNPLPFQNVGKVSLKGHLAKLQLTYKI